MSLTLNKIVEMQEQLMVTYIVKDETSKEALSTILEETGGDTMYRVYVDPKIASDLEGDQIGYRLEALTFCKDKK